MHSGPDLSTFSASDFDRGASRLTELLWVVVKAIVFLSPWPFPSSWRCFVLRCFGARIGKRVVIRSRVNVWFPWRLSLGNDAWLGEEVFILNLAPVTIESSVCISQRAFLCTGSHDFRRRDFKLISRPIVVRAGSWVAAQAFIAPGVEVGQGAVVSAGSVVLDDVPPNTIVQGNPARALKEIRRDSPANLK